MLRNDLHNLGVQGHDHITAAVYSVRGLAACFILTLLKYSEQPVRIELEGRRFRVYVEEEAVGHRSAQLH